MTTSSEMLKLDLEKKTGCKVNLRINENLSTMVSVCWGDVTKVSLHKMFLEAPNTVLDDLICYIKREKKTISPYVKSYIQEELKKVNLSWKIKPQELSTKGEVWDLQAIYEEVELKYFNQPIGLKVTWFGQRAPSPHKSLVLGRYERLLHLIKIHRVLDRQEIPKMVVAYTLFHEMVHHEHLPYVDVHGRHAIHHPLFKKREKDFEDYEIVMKWMKTERGRLFKRSSRSEKSGWS